MRRRGASGQFVACWGIVIAGLGSGYREGGLLQRVIERGGRQMDPERIGRGAITGEPVHPAGIVFVLCCFPNGVIVILMHGEVGVIVIMGASVIAVVIMHMREGRFGKGQQRRRDHEDVKGAPHLRQV